MPTDKQRLDWIEKKATEFAFWFRKPDRDQDTKNHAEGCSIRGVIDAAMKVAPLPPCDHSCGGWVWEDRLTCKNSECMADLDAISDKANVVISDAPQSSINPNA